MLITKRRLALSHIKECRLCARMEQQQQKKAMLNEWYIPTNVNLLNV